MHIYHETLPCGTREFPLTVFRCRRTEKGFHTAMPHYHNKLEILMVKEGKLDLLVGEEQLTAEPGRIYVINPLEIHSFYTATDVAEYSCFIFDRELLELPVENRIRTTVLEPLFQRQLLFPRKVEDPSLPRLFAEIDVLEQQGGQELWILSHLFRFLAVAAPFLWSAEGKTMETPLRRALDYMESHYWEKIPLSLIAEKAGFNSQYFCGYFKKHTGTSPIRYLTELRIRHAKELLCNTDLSVLEVSMQSGFENVSFFIQKFKELTGKTPAKYRKGYLLLK